jgi:hypothetical protein
VKGEATTRWKTTVLVMESERNTRQRNETPAMQQFSLSFPCNTKTKKDQPESSVFGGKIVPIPT